MTGRYVRKSIPLQMRRIDQALIETSAVVQTPAVNDDKQGVQQWAVWSTASSSVVASQRSGFASCSRTSSVCSVTGNFTDRSSVCSFCDDEFDRQESKKVQELFDSIDLILYENSMAGPSHLCRECNEWTSRFPHLRVVGLSQDVGCQVHEIQDDGSNACHMSLLTNANYSSHTLNSVPLASLESAYSTPRPFSFHPVRHCSSVDEEDGEIIEQEGIVDCKIHRDVSSSSVSCLHQSDGCDPASISNSIFSRVWNEVLDTLQPVIQRYAKTVVRSDDPSESVADILVIDDELHDVDPAAQSAVNQTDMYNANRMLVLPDQGDSLDVGGIFGMSQLGGLLMISSKTIQARDRTGALVDAEVHLGGTSLARPSSSLAPLSSRSTVKPSERSTSARTKHFGRPKLAPIASADRLKTPNTEVDGHLHDVLHGINGIKMATIIESQATTMTPMADVRGGMLPPISRDERRSWYRGVSAAHCKDTKPTVVGDHDKTLIASGPDTRPGTSNVLYWSDAPQTLASTKRSSTTIGFNTMHSHHSAQQLESADIGINLSVTGSNVGTAVKAEHQPVNIEDGHQHSMVHSRPASKWSTSHRRSNTAAVVRNAEGSSQRRTRHVIR